MYSTPANGMSSDDNVLYGNDKKDYHDYKNNDDNISGDDGEVEGAVSEVGQL